MTVGQDGVIHTVSAANGLTTLTPHGTGFTTTHKKLDALPPGSLSITSVGAQPVVLVQEPGARSATLLLHGVDQLQLDDVAQAALQQSGPGTPDVLVAASSGLYSVALHGPASVRQLVPTSYPATPAQPVQLRGCVFAAWAGSPGSAASSCGHAKLELKARLFEAADLIFRVNRQQVLLNGMRDGKVWDLDSGTPAELDDWSKVVPPSGDTKPTPGPPQPDPGQPNKPPTAEKDQLGARAGRTTALYVLDNDSDPNQKVLTVATVGQPSSPDLGLAISSDGQTVLLTLPAGASGSYHFQYTNSDGGQRPSQPAIVQVTVAPSGSYRAPVLRSGTKQNWATPVNGSVTIPATVGWRNPFDGDATVLTTARASVGTVTTTADGSLIYSAPAEPGGQHISYTVADGGSNATTTKTLDVNVQPESATPVPAVAQPDFAQGLVGRPLVIYPLDNDLPGSDPSRLNATLSLAGAVGQQKNLQVFTDLQRGTITVTALAAGSYLLRYRAGYGTARPSDEAQIRIAVSGRPTGSIVADPDTAVIHGEAPMLLDVLANDYDPAGNLLDVVQATAGTGDRPLQVAVVQGRWLRINATQNLAQLGEGRISYTISDGLATAVGQVTVNEFPAIQPDQPITEPDFATVRAGGSTTIAVLDNDIDAGGDPITLAQNIGGRVTPGQLSITGLDGSTSSANGTAYVAGNLVRYVAPPATAVTSQRQVRISYRAEAAGTASNGLVTVTITPPVNARTNPDQAPTPADLQAR
ncbi:MAG TPA: Ig-like domain-containing protein, partial [Jatrophihabitans sp.]|nr:Ig-like domain-containing protein [Jatrophihabitans sp.]